MPIFPFRHRLCQEVTPWNTALETWRSVPDPGGAAGCSARINVWASLLVLAAALLRYWDLTVIQPQAQASDGELEQEG